MPPPNPIITLGWPDAKVAWWRVEWSSQNTTSDGRLLVTQLSLGASTRVAQIVIKANSLIPKWRQLQGTSFSQWKELNFPTTTTQTNSTNSYLSFKEAQLDHQDADDDSIKRISRSRTNEHDNKNKNDKKEEPTFEQEAGGPFEPTMGQSSDLPLSRRYHAPSKSWLDWMGDELRKRSLSLLFSAAQITKPNEDEPPTRTETPSKHDDKASGQRVDTFSPGDDITTSATGRGDTTFVSLFTSLVSQKQHYHSRDGSNLALLVCGAYNLDRSILDSIQGGANQGEQEVATIKNSGTSDATTGNSNGGAARMKEPNPNLISSRLRRPNSTDTTSVKLEQDKDLLLAPVFGLIPIQVTGE